MKLTIFTPTYNRVTELPYLYQSIRQAIRHIKSDLVEWIIVDDGSLEDVFNCIQKFETDNLLDIRFYRKKNGGKHTAFNLAIEEADSDIFVCIDDDDRLTENALVDIFGLAKKYQLQGYGGFVGRVVDENGTILGKTIFEDTLESNTIEIRDKYHFWGEPEVFFTDVLKKYRFDVFGNEKFLTEAYLFDKMSIQHPFVYTNIPLMEKKYLADGLTNSQLKIRVNSPQGAEAYYFQRKGLCNGFFPKLKATINRRRFAVYIKKKIRRKLDFYEILAVPLAAFMVINDKHKISVGKVK